MGEVFRRFKEETGLLTDNHVKAQKNEVIFDDDYEDEDDSERLSVWEAAEIWSSNGKDEDYMFGHTEEELENAL